MALATTCPQCKTSFKVIPDQLKLRRGLVRCGVCQHVFSGIDYLRYVDDAARAAQRAARDRAATGDGAAVPATTSPGTGGPPAVQPPPVAAPVDATGVARGSSGAAAEAGAVRVQPPAAMPPVAPPPVVAPTERETYAFIVPDIENVGAGTPVPPGSAAGIAVAPGRRPPDGPVQATPPTGAASAPAGAEAPPAAPSSAPAAPTAPPVEALAPVATMPSVGTMPSAATPAPAVTTPPATPAATLPAIAPAATAAPATGPEVIPAPTSAPGPAFAPAALEASAASRPGTASMPALPAPDARRVPLDELLSRPSAPWPAAPGPQTIIDPGDDLKTAFFLPDSAFGPVPPDAADAGRPTSIRVPAAAPGTLARGRDADVPPRDVAASALPGLPLRPERGEPAALPPLAQRHTPLPVPFEPAPRSVDPVPSEPAIDYFAGTRRSGRGLGLALSPVAWAAAIGLSALLAMQAVVGWRDAIAARVPLVSTTLAALLAPFGLEVGPPRELDALTIEGFELQAAGTPNALGLSAVLRNRSDHVVGYPAMELTLTDGTGALLVRKVITADLYVGDAARIEAGLAARSERPIRLTLQHDGLQATGYAVALFYP
jgi:predicted Zn finger-like uncharacterized protein